MMSGLVKISQHTKLKRPLKYNKIIRHTGDLGMRDVCAV